MVNEKVYDLVVIGGGTAGLVATETVVGLGGSALMIEAERPGGDCLWTGCVPSKALISSARKAHAISSNTSHGVSSRGLVVDFGAVMAGIRRSQATIEQHESVEYLRANGVDVISARGEFIEPGKVRAGEEVVTYRNCLIATGSSPFVPPVEGLREHRHLTSSSLWDLDYLPERLVVLGAGAIGCELGQAFARLGSKVTIIEAAPRLLPLESPEVGTRLAAAFEAEGIVVHVGVMANKVTDGQIHLAGGVVVDFDEILVATGRRPNTSSLGLDKVGVELDERGYVVVDDSMKTSAKHIYAAGDITPILPFTPVAAYEAKLVATNTMFHLSRKANYDNIGYSVFTSPEVGRVGLDAEAATKKWGSDAVIESYDYSNLDRSITDRTGGWVELVGDPKRKLVGATIVGPVAGETVGELAAWITAGAKIDAISTMPHAYPTYSEGPSRVADQVMRGVYFGDSAPSWVGPMTGLARRLDNWF